MRNKKLLNSVEALSPNPAERLCRLCQFWLSSHDMPWWPLPEFDWYLNVCKHACCATALSINQMNPTACGPLLPSFVLFWPGRWSKSCLCWWKHLNTNSSRMAKKCQLGLNDSRLEWLPLKSGKSVRVSQGRPNPAMASLPAHSAANALLRSRLAGYASSPTTSVPACFALALLWRSPLKINT